VLIGLLLAPASPGVAADQPPVTQQLPATPVPSGVARSDQVVVRWRQAQTAIRPDSIAAEGALSVGSGQTVRFVRSFQGDLSIYRLAAPLGADADQTLAALAGVPGVVSVEPDLWVTADALPNDPYASQLWGLKGPADGSSFGINALGAWSTTKGSGVTVAVLDTGLVYSHPDLAGQAVAGYDFISDATIANDGNGRDPDASDPGDWTATSNSSWHGTHVAGTIAALANNSLGVFGGAPQVRIEPVRVLGRGGGTMTDIADAITWAAGGSVSGAPANPTPARVLNLSLGGSGACPSFMSTAIASARSHGAVVVVAAGNSNANAGSFAPADCPGAFAVAATDSAGRKASFSNFGSVVDIAGPGVGIWSTIDTGATSPVGPTYASYSGTSMATPHAALTAALVAAAHPGMSPDQIEAALRAGATPFPPDPSGGCPSLGCGAGIVNAPGALAAAGSGPGSNDFSIGASPASLSVLQGSAGTSTIGTTLVSGSPESVALSVTGLPAGVTAGLSPASVTAGASSTLTLTVSGGAATGTYPLTVTGAAASATHTTPVSLTVTSSAPPPSGSLVNGGFETGDFTGWTRTGTTAIVTSPVHGGTYADRGGSTAATNGDSAISQTFAVPAGGGTLSFWYQVHCPDTVAYDWATATLLDTVTNTTTTLLPRTCANTGAWVQVSTSLAAQAGHSVTLTLTSHDDNYATDPTYTLYDDVVRAP
jgi:serine protease